jgi:DNA-binding transcriptional ArsR family regulator
MVGYSFGSLDITDSDIEAYQAEIYRAMEFDLVELDKDIYKVSIERTHDDLLIEAGQADTTELTLGVTLGDFVFQNMIAYDEDLLTEPIFANVRTPVYEDVLTDSGLAEVLEGEDTEQFKQGFVNQREIMQSLGIYNPERETSISEPEKQVYEALKGVSEPVSALQLTELISEEELLPNYASAKHRPWISQQINSLSKKGLVAKFREGREVMYTSDLSKGFRNSVLKSDIGLDLKKKLLDESGPVTEDEYNLFSMESDLSPRVIREYLARTSWKGMNTD